MANIDYYFSTLSPFTYLAGTRLEETATRHGATITYKPMDIATLFTRTGGVALPDRHPARKVYRLQELRRGAKKAGLPINEQPFFFPTNPAPSSYAIISAQKAGGGDLGGLVHGILSAIWAGNKDIADNEVIRSALSQNGFDPDLADKGMLTAAEEYARNLEDAVSANVFGSPFYIVDGSECFWGHDRLDDLDAYLAGDL